MSGVLRFTVGDRVRIGPSACRDFGVNGSSVFTVKTVRPGDGAVCLVEPTGALPPMAGYCSCRPGGACWDADSLVPVAPAPRKDSIEVAGVTVWYDPALASHVPALPPPVLRCAGCGTKASALSFQGGGCFDFPLTADGMPPSANHDGGEEEQALCPACAKSVAEHIKYLASKSEWHSTEVD